MEILYNYDLVLFLVSVTIIAFAIRSLDLVKISGGWVHWGACLVGMFVLIFSSNANVFMQKNNNNYDLVLFFIGVTIMKIYKIMIFCYFFYLPYVTHDVLYFSFHNFFGNLQNTDLVLVFGLTYHTLLGS